MDPVTIAGALTKVFGAAKAGMDVGVAAHGLVQQVQQGREPPELVDAHLLRLALLSVDRNLVLLDGVHTRVQADRQQALFGVADALEVAPLAALLIHWPPPTDEPQLPGKPSQADFQRWEAALDRREGHAQLLAHARYIVARTTGLSALSSVDAHARKELRLGLRLRNLQQAHLRVRHLLGHEETLTHLIARRV